MTKAELIEKMASQAGISKTQARITLETLITGLGKELKAGNRMTIPQLGTFSVTKRAARKGRNPATGESIRIKAKKVIKFKASPSLKNKL